MLGGFGGINLSVEHTMTIFIVRMWIPRSFKSTTVKIYVHSSHSFWLKLSTVAQDCKNICLLGQVLFPKFTAPHQAICTYNHMLCKRFARPTVVPIKQPAQHVAIHIGVSNLLHSPRARYSTIRNLGCSCVKTVLRCVAQYNII